MEEVVNFHLRDPLCSNIPRKRNETLNIVFDFDDNGLVVSTLQGYQEIGITYYFKERLLSLSHYLTVASHPGRGKVYYRTKRHFRLPALAAEVYSTVRNCSVRERNQIKSWIVVRERKLFPASAPMESVYVDILEEEIKRPRGNRGLLSRTVTRSLSTPILSKESLKPIFWSN